MQNLMTIPKKTLILITRWELDFGFTGQKHNWKIVKWEYKILLINLIVFKQWEPQLPLYIPIGLNVHL